jgi:hypothetical protein
MKTNISISVRHLSFLPLLGLAAGAGLFACAGEFKTKCPEGTVQNGGGDVAEACVAAGAGGAGGQGGEGGPAGQGGQGGQGAGGGQTGRGGGAGAGGDATLTVRGSVTRRNDGKAYAGATFWINGRPVTSDAEGRFEAADVTSPYQLVYREATTAVDYDSYSIYENLSSTDLSLRLQAAPETEFKASLTGTLTGAGEHPQPSGYVTNLIATDDLGQRVGTAGITHFPPTASSEFKVDLHWPYVLGSRINVKLYAIQTKSGAENSIEAYTGQGFLAASVNANETLSAQILPLTPLPHQPVAFAFAAPEASFELARGEIHFRPAGAPDDSSFVFLDAGIASGPGQVSFVVPGTVGTSTDVAVNFSGPDYEYSTQLFRGLTDGASGLMASPPRPAKITAPAQLGALEYGGLIEWSPVEGAIHHVRLSNTLDGHPAVNLYTSATSAVLPDMAAFGLFSPTKAYSMFVYSYGPFGSTDAYLAEVEKGKYSYTFSTQSSNRAVILP